MTDQTEADATDTKRIHASPTKDFFVEMITKDISLNDCILDLLDNAVDGARRTVGVGPDVSFETHWVRLQLDAETFSIEDNCGGIRLSDAIDYAFHFGRRSDTPDDVKGGIGLYGIGMKRAIFKIGRYAKVTSHAPDASYAVTIDVETWKSDATNWDFEFDYVEAEGVYGTEIEIKKLTQEVADAFQDTVFINELIKTISRDYAFLLDKGLQVSVNGQIVPALGYQLTASSNIKPAEYVLLEDGVSVRLTAGLLGELPDEIPDELKFEAVERFGWYIVCNDRIVLAADKSNQTVWGNDQFPVWHPQYAGFAGFAFFYASDQRKLPWTTTKRDIDVSSALYNRILVQMKEITRPFIEYTNSRKAALPEAKAVESAARPLRVRSQSVGSARTDRAQYPVLSQRSREPEVTISYKRLKREVDEIRSQENDLSLSNKDVGIRTFNYYRRMELGK